MRTILQYCRQQEQKRLKKRFLSNRANLNAHFMTYPAELDKFFAEFPQDEMLNGRVRLETIYQCS